MDEPQADPNVKEVPLPSGRFVRVRPVRYLDILLGGVRAGLAYVRLQKLPEDDPRRELEPQHLTVAGIIASVILIDDKPVKIEEYLELDSRDTTAIFKLLQPYLEGPVK